MLQSSTVWKLCRHGTHNKDVDTETEFLKIFTLEGKEVFSDLWRKRPKQTEEDSVVNASVTKQRCRGEEGHTHRVELLGAVTKRRYVDSWDEKWGWRWDGERRDYFRVNLGTEDGEEYYFILFWEGLFWPQCYGCGSYWRNALNYCMNVYCFLLWCRCFSLFVSCLSCWGFNFGLSLLATPL